MVRTACGAWAVGLKKREWLVMIAESRGLDRAGVGFVPAAGVVGPRDPLRGEAVADGRHVLRREQLVVVERRILRPVLGLHGVDSESVGPHQPVRDALAVHVKLGTK